MNDAENLAKLLGRADPTLFRQTLQIHFEIPLPKVSARQGKREIRDKFREALTNLPVVDRRKLDDWAERINLLTDIVGKEAVEAVRHESLDVEQRALFDAVGNEYDRSLWLYSQVPIYFREAQDIRQVKWLRQRKRCHSGFVSPKGLTPKASDQHLDSLHQEMAAFLDRSIDQVAIEMFERSDPEGAVKLYQVCIHHNRAPEVVEYVRDSKVEVEPITRSESIYVTYEPETGRIHVLSKYSVDRGRLAKVVANKLFQTEISGDTIPIKQFTYQHLARSFVLDTPGEPVEWAKVTLLAFSVGGRTMEYRIGVRKPGDIHALARQDLGWEFQFDRHHISAVRITVRVRQQPGEKAHSVHIELRGENGCSVKSERESDRALCDRLLDLWEIVTDVEDDFPLAANDG